MDQSSQIPATAWRRFERGPRNFIGQELAMLEAKVVIALVSRHLDFVKVLMHSLYSFDIRELMQ